jgi:lysophospholipase L1-like esterase
MPRYFSELCQIIGPPRFLKHKPNQTMVFRDFSIKTNSLGLRGAELTVPKPEEEFRLLFLGDSVVLGWGAREQDLFLTLVQEQLNHGAKKQYRCINAGHNRFDTTQEAALLEELGHRIDPDVVLLVYVNNDVDLTIKLWEELQKLQKDLAEVPKGPFSRAKIWSVEKLRGFFRGINDLLALFFNIREQAKAVEKVIKNQAKVDTEGWAASSQALLSIRDWCALREIPFVVLNHTFPGNQELPPEIQPLEPFLKAHEIPCFPFHFTQEEREMPIRRSFSDAHANKLGHELLLKKLQPVLNHLGLKTP